MVSSLPDVFAGTIAEEHLVSLTHEEDPHQLIFSLCHSFSLKGSSRETTP